jgi:hypothetical protein
MPLGEYGMPSRAQNTKLSHSLCHTHPSSAGETEASQVTCWAELQEWKKFWVQGSVLDA